MVPTQSLYIADSISTEYNSINAHLPCTGMNMKILLGIR